MNYEYNGHLCELDRIKLVSKEILKAYPTISTKSAIIIAGMEDKITTLNAQEIEFYRLFNIILVEHDNKILCSEILKRMYDIYETVPNPKFEKCLNNI